MSWKVRISTDQERVHNKSARYSDPQPRDPNPVPAKIRSCVYYLVNLLNFLERKEPPLSPLSFLERPERREGSRMGVEMI
jgi:hypothetical protein